MGLKTSVDPLTSLVSAIRSFEHAKLPESVAKAYQWGMLENAIDTGLQIETPLLLAIRICNLPAVCELLKYPVNISQQGTYWHLSPSGLSPVLQTPLETAIEAANLEAASLLVELHPSQHIPGSHQTCRDVAFQRYLHTFHPRIRAILDKTVQIKVHKDLTKLLDHGLLTEPVKVYAQWHDLVFREILCKHAIENGCFHSFVSKTKKAYFYVTNPEDTLIPPVAIAKDKKEQDVGAHWESFIYKLTLLMNLEILFLPTKKICLIDPKTRQPLKMVLQPYMDPARYLSFSHNWGDQVSMQSYIKALFTQIFFILGDSIDTNVRYDLLTGEIIHFDYEFALTESNTYQDDGELVPMFQTCLLLLPQAYHTLKHEEIAYIQFWMAHLLRSFPQALAYFQARYASTITKTSPGSLNNQETIQNAWHQRLAGMQSMIEALEQGIVTTMADFTLGCFPAYKSTAYGNIALSILKERCENPHTISHATPNPAPYINSNGQHQGLRQVMQGFAELNIPYGDFDNLMSESYFRCNIQTFTSHCFGFPISRSKQTPDQLKNEYMDHANAIEADFLTGELARQLPSHLTTRSPLIPN
ncbi:MAG: hypothetical protein LLG04_01195 [Parachlamydia sp.]|nr:hypothetical protein [Parachlamydia sp.]